LKLVSGNILILSWGFDPQRQGGIARFCNELAVGLQRLGVGVEVWGLLGQGTTREHVERQRLNALGIPTRVVPPYRAEAQTTLTAALMTAQHVRRQQFRYISVHGVLAELCGLLIRARSRVPVVRTVHSEREWYKRPRLGALVDQAYARWGVGEIGVSTRITTMINTRRARAGSSHLARYIPPVGNYALIEQAASITQTDARARLGIPQHAYVVGSVGRWTPQKGYNVLIDAVARLQAAGTDLHVYIVGDGPLEAQLRQQIAQLQLADRVQLLPPRADIDQFLRALDLFVSSSRWEGMSLSMQEAALCGLPVVCTDVSGTDDLLRLFGDQLHVCLPNDSAALAEQILQAKQQPTHGQLSPLSPMQPANTMLWTPEVIAQAYLDYFQTVDGNHPKS
jgi:glycosyltransferase involved in cell wall biosynthesis